MNEYEIQGHVVDLFNRRVFRGEIQIRAGKIDRIVELNSEVPDRYILPGFIDAHIHIESSMMVPSEFARLSVRHGTVATVSDPHEIANVLGVEGVDYMIENGQQVPFKFYFGAPSCVPATPFETAGAEIDVDGIRQLMARPEIKYLAEMMNWPGVLARNADVVEKIKAAQHASKPVDGHAPGLTGEDARRYAQAGITTDHECFALREAQDKLDAGMKIIIREGSAARNFEALIPLMKNHADQLMFCSDDKHPDELVEGHINTLVTRAIQKGYDLFDVLRVACVHPVAHYNLEVGLLRPGDPADFIIVDDLRQFHIQSTYLNGQQVFDGERVLFPRPINRVINQFQCDPISESSICISDPGEEVRVIQAFDGQLTTGSEWKPIKRNKSGAIESYLDEDVLKIVVVNRYANAKPSIGFIQGFGLKAGAIASTVAHDSHNIIAVGVDDFAIAQAINRLIQEKGGICAVHKENERCMPLPVAGLMSIENGASIAAQYQQLDEMAKAMGSLLQAPFMTLSFMALLVIPALKLSDQGLFDGQRFEFVSLVK